MNAFNNLYNLVMETVSPLKVQDDQINDMNTQLQQLGLTDFFIKLPDNGLTGPFNAIEPVQDKICKADAEFFNKENTSQQHFYISLKGIKHRQLGGLSDLAKMRVNRITARSAAQNIIENYPEVKSGYETLKNIFKKLNILSYDFKDLRNNKNVPSSFKKGQFAFKIEDNKNYENALFGHDMNSQKSSENNVDMIICGMPKFEITEDNTIDIKVKGLIGEYIKWNPSLYNVTNINIPLYVCFTVDYTSRHIFNEFKNCRFGIWSENQVKNNNMMILE